MDTIMNTFHARAYRETGGWWTIEIPALTSTTDDGKTIIATGGAISVRGIKKAATELAAVWLDIPEKDVSVSVDIQVPEEVADIWTEAERAEKEGRAVIERGAKLRRNAVRKLRADGYTIEATAAALGVTPQRVHQLTK